MAINIQTENILTLTEATKTIPKINGRRPAVSTMWRWCRKGINGIRLEYAKMGRTIITSTEAINRFVSGVAHADPEMPDDGNCKLKYVRKQSSKTRQRSIEQANAILARAGI